MEKLKLLVFSFYREDHQVKKLLHPLHSCRMTREWDIIRIECIDSHHFSLVRQLLIYLVQPFSLLGLGKKIILVVPGLCQHVYPINVGPHIDLLK